MNQLNKFAWPLDRLGEALEVLGRHVKLTLRSAELATPDNFSGEEQKSLLRDDVDKWMNWACTELGVEVEPLKSTVPEFRSLLQSAAPVIIRHSIDGEFFVLLLLKVRADQAFLITPQQKIERFPIDELHHTIVRETHQLAATEIDQMLLRVGKKNHQKVRDYLYAEFTRSYDITGIWMLRSPPSGSFFAQLVEEKLLHKLLLVLFITTAIYATGIISWFWSWVVMGMGIVIVHCSFYRGIGQMDTRHIFY